MIDISDGLSTDLGSSVRRRAEWARVCGPNAFLALKSRAQQFARKLKLGSAANGLDGGDDYELLFTVPRRLAKLLRSAPEFRDITAIGEIERGKQILLVDSDGHAKPLKPSGWDPFQK